MSTYVNFFTFRSGGLDGDLSVDNDSIISITDKQRQNLTLNEKEFLLWYLLEKFKGLKSFSFTANPLSEKSLADMDAEVHDALCAEIVAMQNGPTSEDSDIF